MKHPLTSKERKGLVAVAVAAFLCIASGPLLRRCSVISSDVSRQPMDEVVKQASSSIKDSVMSAGKDSIPKSEKKAKKKRNKTKAKKKTVKEYPVRNPLDQPCDL